MIHIPRSLIVVLVSIPSIASSQTAVTELSVGLVRARIHAGGRIGSTAPTGLAGFIVPTGPTDLVSPLYTTGLWLSGTTAGGQVRCSAHLYGSDADFNTGPLTVDGTASLPSSTALAYDRFWQVHRTQVDLHLGYSACLNDPDCDELLEYPDYAVPSEFISWPAMGNTAAGQAPYLAPFVDANNNGIYDPSNGDYPCFLGDVAVYHIFNDKKQFQTFGQPLGIEGHMTTFGYWGSEASEVPYALFTHYRLINRSSETYSNFRIGLFADFDLGCSTDDRIGTDVGRNLLYVVNGSNNDVACFGTPGYGVQPPAFGMHILKGPLMDADGLDNIATPLIPALNGNGFDDGTIDNEQHGLDGTIYFLSSGNTAMTDPTQESHFVNYLQGAWKNGTPLTYSGVGLGGTINSAFAFPGSSDPTGVGTGGVPQSPWSDASPALPQGDRKGVAIMGPMTLLPGMEKEILVAYTYARAATGGVSASLAALNQRVDNITALFADAAGVPMLNECSSIATGVVPHRSNDGVRVYPNPAGEVLYLTTPPDQALRGLTILNALGQALIETRIAGTIGPIDIGDLPAGLYMIKLDTGTGSTVRRFVKE